jgi:hypothetical protein
MQQATEHRAHCGNITQQFAPVFDWSIDVSRVLSGWERRMIISSRPLPRYVAVCASQSRR